jgi:succinyl-CoA:acetate CoA-transferase
MQTERIAHTLFKTLITSAEKAAAMIPPNATIGTSGFTKSGDSKAVLPALAARALKEKLNLTLISGASLGFDTDRRLAENGALHKRLPFQSDPVLRKKINTHEVLYIDQHLSDTAEQLSTHQVKKPDIAIIEVCHIDEKGLIYLTSSVGNSLTFAMEAEKLILEVNSHFPLDFIGLHDLVTIQNPPHRKPIPIESTLDRIGSTGIQLDPKKVIAIVETNIPDDKPEICPPDPITNAIASHLISFFENEVSLGRLGNSLLPLQAGIGKVSNAVLRGLNNSAFEQLTMYSEVLQDSTLDLIDSGKMTAASGAAFTFSKTYYERFITHFDRYKDKLLLRPQNISNSSEVIHRLGVIAINTAIECDLYGNVNSTHLCGTQIMNGIGGSDEYARNAYLSIFVCPSISKNDTISHIVPMVSHVDHTEHDVDILVTEQGLADLRGLAPIERAEQIINNCVHPIYHKQLRNYFEQAKAAKGQTPHLLHRAFEWHLRLKEQGTMKSSE